MKLWPVIIVCMLSSIAVLNSIVFFSARSASIVPLDDRPYEQGLNFDSQIAASRVLAKHGLTAEIALNTNSAGHWQLILSLAKTTQDEAVMPELTGGRCLTRHAVSKAADSTLFLIKETSSRYVADWPQPARGVWFIDCEFLVEGELAKVSRQVIS